MKLRYVLGSALAAALAIGGWARFASREPYVEEERPSTPLARAPLGPVEHLEPAVVPVAPAVEAPVLAMPAARSMRPRSRAPQAPTERKEARGAAYAPYLARYIPAPSMPEALALIADQCEEEKTIEAEAETHWEEKGKAANEGELGSLHAVRDLQRETRKKLSALPGSTLDVDAWHALLESTEYTTNCTPSEETTP